MDGKTTKSSVSSSGMKVERNSTNEEIERLKRINGYEDATFIGIEINVTEKNREQIDVDSGSSDTTDSGKKTSDYVQAGNTTILNVGKMSEKIAEGVTLKLKDKEKEKGKETEKESSSREREDN